MIPYLQCQTCGYIADVWMEMAVHMHAHYWDAGRAPCVVRTCQHFTPITREQEYVWRRVH